jgi:tRNA (guanine37-N1)-methyltransferase
MQIDIVSVFPEYFRILNLSLLGKAQQDGLIEINSYNLRDWTHDVHRSVDDTPVGGGAGMVMKPEVWAQCLDELLDLPPVELGEDASRAHDATADLENMSYAQHSRLASNRIMPDTTVIFPDPSAPLFTQKAAQELSGKTRLVFGCGRYEGIDARVGQYYLDQGVDVREYSIGDYVLNGGEVAVCAMVEAITRLIPGFMGNPDSIKDESYTGQPLLEYRQFTRPTSWRGLNVPEILTSGNHARVDRERRNEKLARTSAIRPDLIEKLACSSLDRRDRHYLQTLGWDVSGLHPRRATRK